MKRTNAEPEACMYSLNDTASFSSYTNGGFVLCTNSYASHDTHPFHKKYCTYNSFLNPKRETNEVREGGREGRYMKKMYYSLFFLSVLFDSVHKIPMLLTLMSYHSLPKRMRLRSRL